MAAGAAAHRHGASADEGLLLRADPAGVDAGLRSEDKVSARGTPYSVLLFTPEAQRMVGGALYKTGLTANR